MYPNIKDVQYKYIYMYIKKRKITSQLKGKNGSVGLATALIKFSCFQQDGQEEDLEEELVRLCLLS